LIWVLVALGGGAGSVLRYGVGRLSVHYLGPTSVWGTFLVNVTGSFALGLFIALALEKFAIPVQLRALIAVGLLGGYTTFSTFSLESVQLLESGQLLRAAASLLGNLALGLAAAYLGLLLGRTL
jgi:CrcB protein